MTNEKEEEIKEVPPPPSNPFSMDELNEDDLLSIDK